MFPLPVATLTWVGASTASVLRDSAAAVCRNMPAGVLHDMVAEGGTQPWSLTVRWHPPRLRSICNNVQCASSSS